MKNTPIDFQTVKQIREKSKLPALGTATIRELVRLVNQIEEATGEKFIRMEMGVPGIDPPKVGIEAEIAALRAGVASKYPMIDGLPQLKVAASKFVKAFMDVDVSPANCVSTVGSMQGSTAVFLVANRCDKNKDTILFIDPGFPVQKQQCDVLGMKYSTFDVYNYRGDKLRAKLEEMLGGGNISTLIYSNPNNPSWICFNDAELRVIGEMANKYDVVIVEDLAYFGMDFRVDYSTPNVAPFQPTVAKYSDNYVFLISSSKAFSYAGQRIGMMIMSDKLAARKYPDLRRNYATEEFGYSVIYGALYALSTGVSHSAQYGLAAMLDEAANGNFNFLEQVKLYENRAKVMKKLFTENGFVIVYDKDIDKPVGDGFYFTVSYPKMTGSELLENLLYYGISAISLEITGSERTEGLRACVSQTHETQFEALEVRLKEFNADFGTEMSIS